MQGKFIFTLALLMVFGSACSRHETQKSLARRLSQADRVIVLNQIEGKTMIIRGVQLSNIVQALEASDKIAVSKDESLADTPSNTLVFYNKQGLHLATVPTGADMVFYIDQTPYGDKSGTLRAVAEKFQTKHSDPRQ